MSLYQNQAADTGRSQFARVEPDGTMSVMFFTGKRSSVALSSTVKKNMVSGGITLTRQKNVAESGEPQVLATNSVKLTYNLVEGDIATLDAVKAEVDRVFAIAKDQYQLAHGLVPPSSATFPGA